MGTGHSMKSGGIRKVGREIDNKTNAGLMNKPIRLTQQSAE